MLGALLQEVTREHRDVFASLAQRWQAKANHVQTVKQIFTERAFLHPLLQVLVGGRNHPHIGFDGAVTTHAVEVAITQHPQQTGLQIELHVADFIQEQGATVGLLEAATAHGLRTREGPAFVTKQFTLEQIFGNGRGVDGHKRTAGTLRMFVQCTCHQLFARTGFARDHHGHIALAQAANGAKHVLHGWCLAQHFRRAVHVHRAHGFALAFIHGTADQLNRFGQVEGLGQVLERTALKGRHSAVQIGISRHDDDGQAGQLLFQLAQQIQA